MFYFNVVGRVSDCGSCDCSDKKDPSDERKSFDEHRVFFLLLGVFVGGSRDSRIETGR